MLEKPNPRRPASHRWAIVLFGFLTITLLLLAFNAGAGRVGPAATRYSYIMLNLLFFCALGTVGLLLLLLGGRQQWVYYVVSTFLGLISLRGVCNSVWSLYHVFTRHTPSQLYYHFAQQDKPFVVRQQSTTFQELSIPVLAALVVLLFCRFTFGRPSRSYFGFVANVEDAASSVQPVMPPSVGGTPQAPP